MQTSQADELVIEGTKVNTTVTRSNCEMLKNRFGSTWQYNPDTDSYCTGADYGMGGEITDLLQKHGIPHTFAIGDGFAISVPTSGVQKARDLSFTDCATIAGRIKQTQAEADLIDSH